MTTADLALPRLLSRLRKLPPRILAIIAGVVLLLAYLGYRLYLSRQPYEWSGTVEARTISIGSRVGGRIKEVLVQEGDQVTAGQTLIVLEPGDLPAQKLAAEGQLLQAEANLEKLKHGARPEEIVQARARASTAVAALAESEAGARPEQITAAEARLAAAQVIADKALLDAGRIRKLFKSAAASRADLDNAEAQLRSAVAQREAQRAALDELKNGVRKEELRQARARAQEAKAGAQLVESGSRGEDIDAAQGQVEAAQGKLDSVQVMLDELAVKAPRPARVETLDLRPGDILAPNAVAAKLLEDDHLYVRIYIAETMIGHIRVGGVVPISVDSFPGKSFPGQVEHINSIGEYSPRNLQTADERADQVFAARVRIESGRDQLRAGMAALVRVPR